MPDKVENRSLANEERERVSQSSAERDPESLQGKRIERLLCYIPLGGGG